MQPIRLAARTLVRAPGFTLTAAITLALGIGLTTSVFTVADALLVRRLPVAVQSRVAVLWGDTQDGRFTNFPLSLRDAREFVRRSRTLEQAAFFTFYGSAPKPIREGDRVYRLRRSLVSGAFFDVLRSPPVLGRALRPEDDVVGAAPVAVLSYRAWQRQFAGDSQIVGRSLAMHETGRAHTIVGVMAQGLDYPRGTDFWVPLVANSTGPDSLHVTGPMLDVIGRLRPDASMAGARAELTDWFARSDAPAWQRGFRGVASSLPTLVLGDTKPAVLVLVGATTLLLLLTCVNVANLLLVRGLGRTREFAVRSALGAGRARIAGQLLTESALLAAGGGAGGAALAVALVRGFVVIAPPGVPRIDEISVNAAVILCALAVTTVAMLLFGLVPALVASHVEMQGVLRSGTRQGGVNRPLRTATESLVVGQIALAVVLLFGAGLVTRSLIRLNGVDLSYEPRQLLVAELALRADRYGASARQRDLLNAVLARVAALPAVEAVAPVLSVPFAGPGFGIDGRLSTPEQTPEQAETNPMLNMEIVTPNYFSTLGVRVLRGRMFTNADRDGATPVVVISESVARQYWPGTDPIDKTLKAGTSPEALVRVVGVVSDTRYRDLRTARPSIYFPLRQSFFPVVPMTLVIRTTGVPAAIVPSVRAAIADVDPGVALATAAPLESFLEQPRAQPRLNAMLLSLFAGVAVLLAAVGLFGVIATMVRQRTRELGIRMALGATRMGVQRLVLLRGLSLAALGVLLGGAAALLTSRVLADLLFETGSADRPTLAIVAVLILGVAAVASLIPARTGSQIDPATALRSDQ